MAIYKHFADKNALVNALMIDGLATWEARVSEIFEPDPRAWLERLGDAFLEFALTEPRRYEAAFLLRAKEARQYPHNFTDGLSPVMRQVHLRIEEARSPKDIGDTSTTDVGLAMAALGHGLVSMYRAGRFASEEDFRTAYRRAVRHCIASYLTGFKA
jgi:AcrR family transcriptional regulator